MCIDLSAALVQLHAILLAEVVFAAQDLQTPAARDVVLPLTALPVSTISYSHLNNW